MSKINGGGRLGNFLIRNIVASLLAEKFNLKMDYSLYQQYYNQIDKLGIPLFSGDNVYETTKTISTEEGIKMFKLDTINYNVVIHDYHQNQFYAELIYNYIQKIKDNIINCNPYKIRYDNNNDLLVQVRLGDVAHLSAPFEYYKTIIDKIEYDKGYIRTDSWDHPTVVKLIETYNLQPLKSDEVDVIQFGSTCKYIVVWDGTFSWIFCLLGFYSKLFFYKDRVFCGDIFNIFQNNLI